MSSPIVSRPRSTVQGRTTNVYACLRKDKGRRCDRFFIGSRITVNVVGDGALASVTT